MKQETKETFSSTLYEVPLPLDNLSPLEAAKEVSRCHHHLFHDAIILLFLGDG